MPRYYSLDFEALRRWRVKVHALVEVDQIEHLEEHFLVAVVVEEDAEVAVAEACLEGEYYPFERGGNSVVGIDLVVGAGGFEEGIVLEVYSVVVECP